MAAPCQMGFVGNLFSFLNRFNLRIDNLFAQPVL